MFELQKLFQRRRKMLIRIGALTILGIGGLLIVLPRASAHDNTAVQTAEIDAKSLLLSPDRVSGTRFAAFYALTHR